MTRLIRPYDFILDQDTGWRLASDGGALISSLTTAHLAQGRLTLKPIARLQPALGDRHGSFGGHTLPRGVAVWHHQLFVADPPRHRLLHWQPCGPLQPLATVGGRGPGARQLDTPTGLALSLHGDLIVVDAGNRRLQWFTLPGLALRRIIGPQRWQRGETELEWQPLDVAVAPGGWLYVADAGGRVWKLDAQGRPDATYDGRLPLGVVPQRVQCDRQQRVYGVDADGQRVWLLDRYGVLMPRPEELQGRVRQWLDLHPPPRPAPVVFTAEDEATARAHLLPEGLSQALDRRINHYLAGVQRRQPSLSRQQVWQAERDRIYGDLPALYGEVLPPFLQSVLPPSPLQLLPQSHQHLTALSADRASELELLEAGLTQLQHEPERMTATTPRSDRLVLGSRDRLPILTGLTVDEAGRLRLPDATDGPYVIHRPPAATYVTEGWIEFAPLDSQRLGNPWHRVVLELDAPDRTSVTLLTLTSDVPRPDLAGSTHLAQGLAWSSAPANATEWLIQSPPGRYLYLALRLNGVGDRTPSVTRLYVYAQRQSSLQYLPAVYHQDDLSRQVLDRLLSLCDTLFAELESTIADLPRLLDRQGAPPEFLPWLASWFDLTLEPSWSDRQRRQILSEIIPLYQRRGTLAGLRRLIQLHAHLSDPMPRILEHYPLTDGAQAALATPLYQETAIALRSWLRRDDSPTMAHQFTVVLPYTAVDSPSKRDRLMHLIQQNSPAHTRFTLRPVYPGVRLGRGGSALGIDSVLGSLPPWSLPPEATAPSDLSAQSSLGGSSRLPDPPRPAGAGQLGRSALGATRLGPRASP